MFADQMSEVNNYLYAMGRFAEVQIAFWGNPTTPGHVDSLDYYMSGDVMEIDMGQTHYTEQLIRLEGQAIWFVLSRAFISPRPLWSLLTLSDCVRLCCFASCCAACHGGGRACCWTHASVCVCLCPTLTHLCTHPLSVPRYDKIPMPSPDLLHKREMYSLQPDWVVFACPQSTFKIHPDFDVVLGRFDKCRLFPALSGVLQLRACREKGTCSYRRVVCDGKQHLILRVIPVTLALQNPERRPKLPPDDGCGASQRVDCAGNDTSCNPSPTPRTSVRTVNAHSSHTLCACASA